MFGDYTVRQIAEPGKTRRREGRKGVEGVSGPESSIGTVGLNYR